jgi:hypothetical protein
MQQKIINEKFPVYYQEIMKGSSPYGNIAEIIDALKAGLAKNPSSQVIAVFDLHDHVQKRGGKIADGILGAQTLLFCVANAIPHADIVALRPRSIGVTEFADRFVLNFLEAPAQPVTDTMLALVDAVA